MRARARKQAKTGSKRRPKHQMGVYDIGGCLIGVLSIREPLLFGTLFWGSPMFVNLQIQMRLASSMDLMGIGSFNMISKGFTV